MEHSESGKKGYKKLDRFERLVAFVEIITTDSPERFLKAYRLLTGRSGVTTLADLQRWGEI